MSAENSKTKRCAIYARASTSHHDQKPENQITDLEQYAAARGWSVTAQITDHGFSGGTDKRPGLVELMALARSRKIDVIIVTKLDRLFRSLKHLITTLDELEALGVEFVSVGDQIDLTTSAGRLLVQLLGAFGEFERALIRERTVAGLAHARRKGTVLGRRRIHSPKAIRDLRAGGASYREIAKHTGAPMGTITSALRSAQ